MTEEGPEVVKKSSTVEEDKCIPLPGFKRNNFFFGKLLTVNDFKTEQKFFVDKIRLINRLIFGAGVIAGLKVSDASDLAEGSIRVEKGIVLDFCGREIIVPNPVDILVEDELKKKDIELVDGPNELYVYVKYASCYSDLVPKALESATCQEQDCYSRITEGYEIGITKDKPNPDEPDNLVCDEWDDLINDPENPEVYDFLINRPLDCFEDRVIVLAKITVLKSGDSISLSTVNNAVGVNLNKRRLVYSNEILYKLIECLKLVDIKKLQDEDNQLAIKDAALEQKIENLEKLYEELYRIVMEHVGKVAPRIDGINWVHDTTFREPDQWLKATNKGFTIHFTEKMVTEKINSKTLSLTLEKTTIESNKTISIQKIEMPIGAIKSSADNKQISFAPDSRGFEYNQYFGEGLKSLISEKPTKLRLIIQLRGDFIFSEKREICLDGNYLRGTKLDGKSTTGNGTEGGLFESWISLELKESPVNVNIQPTEAYLTATPNPLGIGQKLTLSVQVMPKPPDGEIFHGLKLEITKPDGAVDTQEFESDKIGMGYSSFTPTIPGTYTVNFSYGGEEFTSTSVRYQACKVGPISFTAQEEPVSVLIADYNLPFLEAKLKGEEINDEQLRTRIADAELNTDDLEKMDRALANAELSSVKVLAEAETRDVMKTLRVSEAEAMKLIKTAKAIRG